MANNGAREKIVRPAYLRFYEFGYNGTSIQDIVDAAGLPKGTFYNYFKSKELLAIEALKEYACIADQVFVPPSHPLNSSNAEASSDVETIRKQFQQATSFYEGVQFARGCLMGNFTAESSDFPESFRNLINESFRRWARAIEATLTHARRAGEISKLHKAKKLARYLLTSWQGALLLAKSEKSRVPIDEFSLFTFDFLLKNEPSEASKTTRNKDKPRKKA